MEDESHETLGSCTGHRPCRPASLHGAGPGRAILREHHVSGPTRTSWLPAYSKSAATRRQAAGKSKKARQFAWMGLVNRQSTTAGRPPVSENRWAAVSL